MRAAKQRFWLFLDFERINALLAQFILGKGVVEGKYFALDLGAPTVGALVEEFDFFSRCCFRCHGLILRYAVCFFKTKQALFHFFQRGST